MNNTTSRYLTAIITIFITAVLVVGGPVCASGIPPRATLSVIEHVECSDIPGMPLCPQASAFTITVTGNNPQPSTFTGSEDGTLVSLGPGTYKVTERTSVVSFASTFSSDCTRVGNGLASGTISAGEHATCRITNTQRGA
jgi:hypothetical protein